MTKVLSIGASGKLLEFTPQISDISGLQTALDGKAATSHNQAWSTITSTPTTLSGYGITNGAGLSANTFTGLQRVNRSGSSGTIQQFDRSIDSIYLDVLFSTGGSARWYWRFQGAETGANAGGTLDLIRRADDGSNLGSIVNFYRDTGMARFQNDVNVVNDLIVGTDPGGTESLRVGGSGLFTGIVKVGDGTAGYPTLTFINDSNTGFFSEANGVLGVSINGTRNFSFTGSSFYGYLTSDTATSAQSFGMVRRSSTGTNGQVQSGYRLGILRFIGVDDTGNESTGSAILGYSAENWLSTSRGSTLDLCTTNIGATSFSTKVRVFNDGGVKIGPSGGSFTTSPGAGWLAASGGIFGTDPGGTDILRVTGNLTLRENTSGANIKLKYSTTYSTSINTNNAGGFFVQDDENTRIFLNYDRSINEVRIGPNLNIRFKTGLFHLRGGTPVSTTAFGEWSGSVWNYQGLNQESATTYQIAQTLAALIRVLRAQGVIGSS